MKVVVPMVGSVWPSVHAMMINVPEDERALASGKLYDERRSEWYVLVHGQKCLFV
jgi:hypothetical protein